MANEDRSWLFLDKCFTISFIVQALGRMAGA
jgi:hypothetical protein